MNNFIMGRVDSLNLTGTSKDVPALIDDQYAAKNQGLLASLHNDMVARLSKIQIAQL